MQWFRDEINVTHHLHMFGFTGLTVINPRIQFIRFAQFPNFAEVHRTEQTLPPSPPRDTEGLFFLCEKKHKTAFCDYVEEQNVTKPHFILTSPGTGWASSASFGTAAAALGHSPCGGCRVGTCSQGEPWQPLLVLLQDQRHCTLPGSLVKCSAFIQTYGY